MIGGCNQLEHVDQSGDGNLVLGDIQGQAEQGFVQLDLAVDVPFHCRGVGIDDFQGSFPAQMVL